MSNAILLFGMVINGFALKNNMNICLSKIIKAKAGRDLHFVINSLLYFKLIKSNQSIKISGLNKPKPRYLCYHCF